MSKRLHTTCYRKCRALLLCFQKPKLLAVEQPCLVMGCGWERGKTMVISIREVAKSCCGRGAGQLSSVQSVDCGRLDFFAMEVWLPWKPVFSCISASVESPSVPATSLF